MTDDRQMRVIRSSADAATVTVSGEIDRSVADELRESLDAAAVGHDQITVDLTGVTYLDSSGIAVLFERAARGTTRFVAGPLCLVTSVLEITGLPVEPPDTV